MQMPYCSPDQAPSTYRYIAEGAGAYPTSPLPNYTTRHTGQFVARAGIMAIPIRQFRSRHHDYHDSGGGEGTNGDYDAPGAEKEDRTPIRDDGSPESVASLQGRRHGDTERDERGRRNFYESKRQGYHYYYTW